MLTNKQRWRQQKKCIRRDDKDNLYEEVSVFMNILVYAY